MIVSSPCEGLQHAKGHYGSYFMLLKLSETERILKLFESP